MLQVGNITKRRILLLPLCACLGIISYAVFSLVTAEDWPGVKYAEVRAYAWPGSPHHDRDGDLVILQDMTLKDGVINKDGALLSSSQVKRLLAAVTGNHEAHVPAACYEPHNAFVFYDSGKKPVAFVEICFDCQGRRMQPPTTSKAADLTELAAIFRELKLPTGTQAEH